MSDEIKKVVEISEKNWELLRKIVSEVNEKLPDGELEGPDWAGREGDHAFWAAKDIREKDVLRKGFALYAYGGTVAIFYEANRRLTCSFIEDTKYEKYFGDDWATIGPLRQRIKSAPFSSSTKKTKLELFSEITAEEWSAILRGYRRWSEKNQLERGRQTAICHDHRDINTLYMVTMELIFQIDGKSPRMDMAGIRKSGDGYILSLIEYKCTDNGFDGVTLSKHYDDMVKFSRNGEGKMLLIEYLERKLRAEGPDESAVTGISPDTLRTEIVFLFSNVYRGEAKKHALSAAKIEEEKKKLRDSIGQEAFNAIRMIELRDEIGSICL